MCRINRCRKTEQIIKVDKFLVTLKLLDITPMSYKKQELLNLCKFFMGSVLLILLVFYVLLWVFFLALSCVLCAQCCQSLWNSLKLISKVVIFTVMGSKNLHLLNEVVIFTVMGSKNLHLLNEIKTMIVLLVWFLVDGYCKSINICGVFIFAIFELSKKLEKAFPLEYSLKILT